MTATNADMTGSQLWVPLSEGNALALAEGFYTIGSENLQLSSIHMAHPGRAPSASNRPNGRVAVRGVGGSTPATHASASTLTRYYPEGPGGGGSAPTLAEVLAASGDLTVAYFYSYPATTPSGTVNPAVIDTFQDYLGNVIGSPPVASGMSYDNAGTFTTLVGGIWTLGLYAQGQVVGHDAEWRLSVGSVLGPELNMAAGAGIEQTTHLTTYLPAASIIQLSQSAFGSEQPAAGLVFEVQRLA